MTHFSIRWLAPLTLGALLIGCHKSSSDEFTDAVPEQAALQMTVTDDTASEGLATDGDAVDGQAAAVDSLQAVAEGLAADPAAELRSAREAVKDLNESLRAFLQPIVAMVRDTEPTTETAGRRVWGPVVRGGTEYQFTLVKGLRKRFGWKLEARPEGSSDAFIRVAAGAIAVGAEARRGVGGVGFDLDALSSVDPTVSAKGLLLAGFAHGPLGTTLRYRLKDFSRTAEDSPVSGLIAQVHLKSGFNRLRLAYYGNLPETATDAKELVLARVRHLRDLGGRADLLVTGGDVPEGSHYVVSECWTAGLESTYRIVRDCPLDGVGGEDCTVLSTTGEASACIKGLEAPELPPADPNADMAEPEDPNEAVEVPAAMPEGTASEG